MLFSYVPFSVTVMVLGCPDYLHFSKNFQMAFTLQLPQLFGLVPAGTSWYKLQKVLCRFADVRGKGVLEQDSQTAGRRGGLTSRLEKKVEPMFL